MREWTESADQLGVTAITGLVYDPLHDRWSRSPDTDVNYLAASAKAG